MDWPHAGRTEGDVLFDPGGERDRDIDMLACADCAADGDGAADRRCGTRVQGARTERSAATAQRVPMCQ
jgi:hypothetical protein